MIDAPAPPPAPPRGRLRWDPAIFGGASAASWASLAFIVAVGLYMYADRHVVTLQVQPIKAQLGLNDLQIGLLQGLGVAVFASVTGFPIAWLSDRYDRRLILCACVLTWCAAVAASGLAQSFWQLMAASAVVGAGEAGLLPITYAAIPDLFSGRSRDLANALVIVIGRIGSGIVIAGTGFLIQAAGHAHAWLPPSVAELAPWRLTFLAIALPGPLFALAALAVRLGARGGARAQVAEATRGPGSPILPFVGRHAGVFLPFCLGVGLLVFGTSAFGAFLPVVAMRQMGASPAEVGAGVGAATTLSTLVAMAAVVAGAPVLRRRVGPRYPVFLLTIASLAPALLSPLYLLARTPTQIFWILGVSFLFLAGGSMAYPTAVQELTPRRSRARLVSVTIVSNIVLSAAAPTAVGALSDALGHAPGALTLATVVTGAAGLALSAALLLLAMRGYGAAVAEARAIEDADAAG